MSTRRGRRAQPRRAGQPSARGWLAIWLTAAVVTVAVVLAAERTSHGRSIVSSVQQFLLFYMGAFALIGLTAAVGVGLLAADRIVMRPGSRVVAQAVHRGVSLAALAALVAHIVLEIVAHRSQAVDAVVPFVARSRTLYVGLGTVASDLILAIVVSGFLRGRFAGRWPWAWRVVHGTAYLAWPLAVVHGLMAGRAAKPYVDWSYGACLAAVALALAVRFAATTRTSQEKRAQPVPERLSAPADGLIPGTRVTMTPLTPGGAPRRALPAPQAEPYPSGGWPAGPPREGYRREGYAPREGYTPRAGDPPRLSGSRGASGTWRLETADDGDDADRDTGPLPSRWPPRADGADLADLRDWPASSGSASYDGRPR